MKKQQLILCGYIFIFFPILLNFQTAFAQKETGLKGGILFSDIVADDNVSNLEIEKRDGILIGAFYKGNELLGRFGIQAELLYQQKGANFYIEKIEPASDASSEVYTFDVDAPKSFYKEEEVLHYISIPVLLTFPTTDFLELYVGPDFGYLVSSKTNRQETGDLNRFSAGVSAGVILNFCNNTSIDLRYSRDLSSFDHLGNSMSLDTHNQGISVTLQQKIFVNK